MADQQKKCGCGCGLAAPLKKGGKETADVKKEAQETKAVK